MQSLDPSLCFDPVIAQIFTNTAQLENEKIAMVVEWFVYSLWLKQSLNTSRTIDSSIAAVLRNFDLDSGRAVPDFEDQLARWKVKHAIVEGWIDELLNGERSFARRTRNYLLGQIRQHKVNVVSQDRQLRNLAGTLYKATSDAVYKTSTIANADFNPTTHFQVGIVTWLKVCGGEPKVVETHNVPKGTERNNFLKFLTTRTKNVQVEELGYPDGFISQGTEWLWRVTKGNLTLYQCKLETNDMYNEMTRQATTLPDDQKLIIIHVSFHDSCCALDLFSWLPGLIRRHVLNLAIASVL